MIEAKYRMVASRQAVPPGHSSAAGRPLQLRNYPQIFAEPGRRHGPKDFHDLNQIDLYARTHVYRGRRNALPIVRDSQPGVATFEIWTQERVLGALWGQIARSRGLLAARSRRAPVKMFDRETGT